MMPDREKVIELFSSCISKGGWNNCTNCEHGKAQAVLTCKPLAEDVLKVLKEQEAVEPILIREGRNKHYNDYVCPRCDNEVVYEQNYCSECGVRFMWEGR